MRNRLLAASPDARIESHLDFYREILRRGGGVYAGRAHPRERESGLPVGSWHASGARRLCGSKSERARCLPIHTCARGDQTRKFTRVGLEKTGISGDLTAPESAGNTLSVVAYTHAYIRRDTRIRALARSRIRHTQATFALETTAARRRCCDRDTLQNRAHT